MNTFDFDIIDLNVNNKCDNKNFTFWNNDLCVLFNFTKSNEISTFNNNPTLCLHGTINYAPIIFEHLQKWPSFISFALFIEESDFEALELYQSMIKCHPKSHSYVSTHLVFKNCSSKNTIIQHLENMKNEKCCFQIKKNIKKYLYKFNRYSTTEYPINSLRNIARFGSSTEFLVNSDIENIFSKNAHLILMKIIENLNESEKEKTAIVIRRFETSDFTEIPENVHQFVKSLKEKRVFNFHHHFFGKNHLIPNLNEWINESILSNKTSVKQIKYQYFWEPLTVTHRSSPPYFEGLLYRYRNQIAYVYELCRAKFKFVVASHIFTIHKGIKKELTRKEKFYMQGNWEKSFQTWNNFEEMIKLKYQDTEKFCENNKRLKNETPKTKRALKKFIEIATNCKKCKYSFLKSFFCILCFKEIITFYK